MRLFDRKIIFLAALSLALASAARAQDNTCSLQLNPVAFIEGTTDTNAVEKVSLTLTGGKKQFKASLASPSLFEGLPEGNYKIAATRSGFRTTRDFIYLSCSNSPQTIATKMVIMWKGDPAKTVDYTGVSHSAPAKSGRNNDQQIMIDNADSSPGVSGGAPAVIRKARPANGTQGSLTLGGPIGDTSANAASNSSAINKDVVNDSALVLAKPKFPPTARAVGANGAVQIQVTIDEDGYVIEANPISGHPLLRAVSALAAKASVFKPTTLSGLPVKVSGIIVYNFQ
jgi:hypothetical protein